MAGGKLTSNISETLTLPLTPIPPFLPSPHLVPSLDFLSVMLRYPLLVLLLSGAAPLTLSVRSLRGPPWTQVGSWGQL